MSMSEELMGVILAAGKGTRMHPFSTRFPKPILPVGGKPLVAHQLEEMASLGIREVVIVIGHLGHEVVATLGDGGQFGLELHYVEQQETLGIANAVARLEPYVDRPFFLFLGDIFFEFRKQQGLGSMVERLGNSRDTAGVLAVKREQDPEAIKRNFIVVTDQNDRDRVTRVIEKPRYPQTDVKGCGIYLFDVSFFDAVRRTPRTAMRDEYEITDSIQIFLDDGYRVEAAEVIEEDVNLSFARDLLDLNMRFLDREGHDNWLGKNVTVHPDARLERCVVMDGAVINGPVRLRNCVLFPGVNLDGERGLVQTIVTPEAVIQCEE